MTIYIKNSDGSRVSAYEVRADQPAGSAMKAEMHWDENYLHSRGYSILTEVSAPTVSSGQIAVKQEDQEIEGTWTEVWAVEDKTTETYEAELKQEAAATCEAWLNVVKTGYPAGEVESWTKQEADARAFTLNPLAVTPLLDALSVSRGVTKTELAAKIIIKADAFASVVGTLIGTRQKIEDVITTQDYTDFDDLYTKTRWPE